MIDLLKLEFRRLFRAKSFYICLASALVMGILTAVVNKMLLNIVSSDEIAGAFGTIVQAPTAFSMLKTAGSASLTSILALFISIFVSEDYSGDMTIKNIYAKGQTRDTVFFAKFISTIASSFLMILACAVFSFAMGKILFGEWGEMGKNYVGSLFAELLILFAYSTIYFAIAISLKKMGAAIAISIVASSLFGLVLQLADLIIKSENINLADYWLDGRLSILEQPNVTNGDLLAGFLVGAVILLAFGAAGFLINRYTKR